MHSWKYYNYSNKSNAICIIRGMFNMTKNEMRDKIGKYIKRERVKYNITQQELAEKTNLSVVYISEIERGIKAPGYVALARIIDVLHMDSRIIFPYSPDQNLDIKKIYEIYCDAGKTLNMDELIQIINLIGMIKKA